MQSKFTISLYLDTRRKKANGKYPLKLRVYSSLMREPRMYKTGFEFTEKEFEEIYETSKPRKEYRDTREKLISLETKAVDKASRIKAATFEAFEATYFGTQAGSETLETKYLHLVKSLEAEGRIGTSESYEQSWNSLSSFFNHQKKGSAGRVVLEQITPKVLKKYEAWMTSGNKPKSITTVGIYLRTLRAIFNTAIDDKEIDPEAYPFGKQKGRYQIPATKGVKKALKFDDIKALRRVKLPNPMQDRARDYFLFSYACSGINMKDIALLKWGDIKDGKIVFYRAKTINTRRHDLKPIQVHLTALAYEILDKYGSKSKNAKQYIFPILKEGMTEKEKKLAVKDLIRKVDWHLKRVAESLCITGDISFYWGRHSFSTIAIQHGASMELVGDALGHSTVKTTQGYFAGFEDETMRDLADKLTDLD